MPTTPNVKLQLHLPKDAAPVKIVSQETKTGRDAGDIRMAEGDQATDIELDGDKHATLLATAGTLGTEATLESSPDSTHNVEGAVSAGGGALSKFILRPGEKVFTGIATDLHQISLRLGAERDPPQEPEEKLEEQHPA